MDGIEPSFSVPQTDVLPLDDIRQQLGRYVNCISIDNILDDISSNLQAGTRTQIRCS